MFKCNDIAIFNFNESWYVHEKVEQMNKERYLHSVLEM